MILYTGLVQLGLTLVVTSLNMLHYLSLTSHHCPVDTHLCLGPLIKVATAIFLSLQGE